MLLQLHLVLACMTDAASPLVKQVGLLVDSHLVGKTMRASRDCLAGTDEVNPHEGTTSVDLE